MLLKQDGSVWSTDVSLTGVRNNFAMILSRGAIAIACRNHYSLVIGQDGNVWITGKNSRLGDGSQTSENELSFLQKIPFAVAAYSGEHHSMVLTQYGFVWTAGWNKYGQLGDGSTIDRNNFFAVISSGRMVMSGATGDFHSIVLRRDGTVLATGRNHNGQLGDGSKTDRSRFVEVVYSDAIDRIKTMSTGATAVAAGGYHSLILHQDGSVWATGWNQYGQLGDGTIIDSFVYKQVVSSGTIAVAAGSRHSMILKQDGSVWATGWNEYGQLGDGTTKDKINYMQVLPNGAKAIAAGSRHSMILKQDGSVWAAGYNLYGQLGDGWTHNTYNFVEVISDGVQAVAAGGIHSMIAKQDGSIWATGSNEYAQYGDGSTTSEKFFVKILSFGNGVRRDDLRIDISLTPRSCLHPLC